MGIDVTGIGADQSEALSSAYRSLRAADKDVLIEGIFGLSATIVPDDTPDGCAFDHTHTQETCVYPN